VSFIDILPKGVRNNPTIQDLLINEGIYYNLLEQKVHNVPQDLFKLVSTYFNYRHLKENTDYGILAGIVAYDVLVETGNFNKVLGMIFYRGKTI
jgi:hypothetical protein